MRMGPTLLVLSLIVSAGCQTVWTRVDTESVAYKGDHFAVDLPTGWVRLQQRDVLLVTRDGIGIQSIVFRFREHGEAFEKTKQQSAADMLPSELADRYVAELRAADEHGLPSLEIITDRPTTISGRLGFEVHLQFLNDDGLRYERVVSGFANKAGLFVVSYEAPSLHFFQRDLAAYRQALETFEAI